VCICQWRARWFWRTYWRVREWDWLTRPSLLAGYFTSFCQTSASATPFRASTSTIRRWNCAPPSNLTAKCSSHPTHAARVSRRRPWVVLKSNSEILHVSVTVCVYGLFYPAFVCLPVCLFVSNLTKICRSYLGENFTGHVSVDEENWLNSGSRPRLDSDLGIFRKASSTLRDTAFFYNLAHVSG